MGSALLWLGPALLLIGGVVIYPAIELVRASMSEFSITGLRLGDAGMAQLPRRARTTRCSAPC